MRFSFIARICRPASALLCLCGSGMIASLPANGAQAEQATERKVFSPDDLTEFGVGSFALPGSGDWFAYSASHGDVLANLSTGKRLNARPEWMQFVDNFREGWSPVGPGAAISVRREGKYALSLWSGGEALSDVRELLVFPRDLYPKFPAVWSTDGKFLFMVVGQDLPWMKSRAEDDDPPTRSHNVELGVTAPYAKVVVRERFEKEYPEAYAEQERSLVLVIEVASGRMALIARGNDIVRLLPSPDGRRLAMLQAKDGGTWLDIYLIDIPPLAGLPGIDLEKLEDRKAGWSDSAGRRLAPVMTDMRLSGYPSWSPDGARLAYVQLSNQQRSNVFLYDLGTKQTRNISRDIVLGPNQKQCLDYNEHLYRDVPGGFGDTPLWMPNSREVLVKGTDGGVWDIPVDEHRSPRDLTEGFSLLAGRILKAPRTGNLNIAAIDGAGNAIMMATQRESCTSSFWKVGVTNRGMTKIADADFASDYRPQVDAAGKAVFYAANKLNTVQNVHRLKLTPGSAPELMTQAGPQFQDMLYPDSRVLSWKTAAGYSAYGLLFLPESVSTDRKAPLIVESDPGADSQLWARLSGPVYFARRQALFGRLHAGYAVLYPDIPMSMSGKYQQPLKQVAEGAIAATDAALATGLIDEKRMGIIGEGYGGFMVQAVVTQTDRFKAAISIDGITNWLTKYSDRIPRFSEYEMAYGRMEKPVWEEPARYLDNSPLRYLDKVHTPLLIIHGNVSAYPTQNSWEAFAGLARLERTTIFANYVRQGMGNPEAMIRAEGWFREHLLGGPPVSQIADQGSFMFGKFPQ